MDCIVHGVAKSQTQLSDFHFHFHLPKKLSEPQVRQIQHTHLIGEKEIYFIKGDNKKNHQIT